MEKKNIMIIVAIIAVVCIVFAALFFSGVIHNGSFAAQGATFGPGTYVVGTDIPEGSYDLEDPFEIEGNAVFHASSQGGLSISNSDVHLESGATVTILENGSMTYNGSD